ncbi:hypothetical protein [Petrachloros mirabilis]
MLNFISTLAVRQRLNVYLIVTVVLSLFSASVSTAADEGQFPGVPDWRGLIQAHQEALGKIQSNQSAAELFIGAIGPGALLNDVAAAIAAKGIPPKLSAELLIPEITTSALRLVAALTAWQLSDRITQALTEVPGAKADSITPSPPQIEWLTANGPFQSLSQAAQQLKADDPRVDKQATSLAVLAGRLAQEAGQQATTEWWKLRTWKDRVRVARGQSRLCGTWQWIVHDHTRHHQEQKLSLIFPPPGITGTGIQGLTEIVVLGDVVYLRWEADGQTQEDSLMFSKEGARLEGTFVNSQGGWGSITGKRTASCTLQ